MKDTKIDTLRNKLLNEARLMHERAYAMENACDALQILTNADRFGSEAIVEHKAKLRKWLDEYPSDVLPIMEDVVGDK